jgi:signal transduction histidine kinase
VEVIASVDGDGHFLSVSKASTAVWKRSPDDLIGMSIFDIVVPEDLLLAQQGLLAASFMKQSKTFECRVLCPDMTVVPMTWTAQWSDVDNATMLVAQKPNTQTQTVDMFKDSKERTRLLLEAIPVGLFLATQNGKIEFANKTLEHMLETGAIGLDARPVHSVFGLGGGGKQAESSLPDYLDKQTELVVKSGADRDVPIELTLKRINVAGVLMYLGTVVYIGERHEFKRLKKRFLNDVNDQLKLPLMRITGAVQNSLKGMFGTLNSQGKAKMEASVTDAQKMLIALDTIIETDKLESGDFEVEMQPNDMMVLVKQVVLSMLSEIREADLTFELNGPDEAPVLVDEEKMFQAVATLLHNAIRFSPKGNKVRVQLIEEDGRIRVEVIDRGLGMSEELKKAVFDRFRKPSEVAEPGAVGSGKSLLIAKHIVEKHAGIIGVISSLGNGSNFWIELPKA